MNINLEKKDLPTILTAQGFREEFRGLYGCRLGEAIATYPHLNELFPTLDDGIAGLVDNKHHLPSEDLASLRYCVYSALVDTIEGAMNEYLLHIQFYQSEDDYYSDTDTEANLLRPNDDPSVEAITIAAEVKGEFKVCLNFSYSMLTNDEDLKNALLDLQNDVNKGIVSRATEFRSFKEYVGEYIESIANTQGKDLVPFDRILLRYMVHSHILEKVIPEMIADYCEGRIKARI